MSVHTIEEVSPTRRKFNITVSAADIRKSWDKIVQEIQSSAEVRGFRKGKAPVTLIKTVYAQDIAKKVVNAVVDNSYHEVVKESKLQILNQPEFKPESELNENTDFTFSAIVDIFVPVVIKDYKGLSVKLPSKLSPTAENEEFEKALQAESKHGEECKDHAHHHEPITEEYTQKFKNEIHEYFEFLRADAAYEQVVDQLLAKHPFDVADTLVELTLDQVIYNGEVIVGKKDPKLVNFKDKSLREQYQSMAMKNVKAVVALVNIAEQEKIVVPMSEVTKSAANFLMDNQWNYQKIRENQAAIMQEHKTKITLKKAVNFLLNHGTITWE